MYELTLEELVEGGGVGMRMKQEQNVSRVSLTVSTMKNLCCAFVFCFFFFKLIGFLPYKPIN